MKQITIPLNEYQQLIEDHKRIQDELEEFKENNVVFIKKLQYSTFRKMWMTEYVAINRGETGYALLEELHDVNEDLKIHKELSSSRFDQLQKALDEIRVLKARKWWQLI